MGHDITEIGGAPANEECAQLGITPDFDRLNELGVSTLEAALIAKLGSPPSGASFVRINNRHDFGTYVTLGIRVDDERADDPAVRAYASLAEEGLATWLEAGFTAPVDYTAGSKAPRARSLGDVIRSALSITRPGPDGRFPIPEFERLHTNLTQAYPEHASRSVSMTASA